MAANTLPIFPKASNIQWGGAAITAANTTKDLTSGTNYPIFTAGSEGSRVSKVKVRPLGTNVATVMRFWINNGSTTGTASNNTLIYELTLPATTVSEVAAQNDLEYALDLPMPAGYKLIVTIGTAVAAGHHATAIAGDY